MKIQVLGNFSYLIKKSPLGPLKDLKVLRKVPMRLTSFQPGKGIWCQFLCQYALSARIVFCKRVSRKSEMAKWEFIVGRGGRDIV